MKLTKPQGNLKQLLTDYINNGHALVAFNVQNIYQLKALYDTTALIQKPAIAQLSAKFVSHFDSLYGLENIVQRYQNPLLHFHLDHCLDFSIINRCLSAGFDSIMFDGSSLPLQSNIDSSNKAHALTSSYNALLELELGAIGGVEDGMGSEHHNYYSSEDLLQFVKHTRFDLLALAIGNAHGIYHSLSEIKMEKLKEAKDLIGSTPFVLHGGTGLTDDLIQESISYGVVKINISTALKIKHMDILKDFSSISNSYDELEFVQYYHTAIHPFYSTHINKFA